MKKLRIYIDTSVIGGCFDLEFKIWSDALMEDFRQRLMCRYSRMSRPLKSPLHRNMIVIKLEELG